MVNWRSAKVRRRIFGNRVNSPIGEWEEVDFSALDAFVEHVYESGDADYFLPQTVGSSCGYDRLRALCGYFFRRCRHGRESMTPHDMCISVCQEYRSDCLVGDNADTIEAPVCDNVFAPTAYAWDCANNDVLEEDLNCAAEQPTNECVLVPHEGYYLLDIEYGPYDTIPEITLTFVVAWFFAATMWIVYSLYLSARDENGTNGNALTRVILVLPLFMGIYLSVAYFFWATCEKWGECNYWLSVGMTNCKLIWEVTLFLVLMLCGKGWFIYRHHLSQFELRRMVLLVCLFYLADSLLMVLQEYVRWFYWCLLTFLYAFVLFYVLSNMRKIVDHYSNTLLQVDIGSDTSRIFLTKLGFFLNFRVLVIAYVVAFIVIQGLQHSIRNAPLWPLILTQYVLDFLLFLSIMYLLRTPNSTDLFSTIGDGDIFGEDNFERLAPMVVADIGLKRSAEMRTLSTERRDRLRNSSEKAANSTAAISPVRSNRKRSFSLLGAQRDENRSRGVVAPVVIIRNPGGKFDLCLGVKVASVEKFKNSKLAAPSSVSIEDDNDGADGE